MMDYASGADRRVKEVVQIRIAEIPL